MAIQIAPLSALATKCNVSLLLVGKTGVGKSATGNTILNLPRNPFKVDFTDVSVTSTCQYEYSRYQGRTVKVVDMPGVSNSSKNKAEDIKDVEKTVTTAVYETPDGYDAVLVVVQFGRQSREDKQTIDSLKGILERNFFRDYGILVVTHGDEFKRKVGNNNIKDFCSKQKGLLNQLWKECKERVVLFDNETNKEEEKEAQRKELFDLVDAMRRSRRYTPKMFEAAKEKRDELIAKAEEFVLTDEKKSTLRLMMHDLNSVNLKTKDKCIGQLGEIKARAEKLIKAETQPQERKVKKIKAILAMAESIKKATENRMKLASLIEQFPNDAASSEMSVEKAKEELESQEKIVAKNDKDLYEQYEKLIQEDIATKAMIALAALVILGIGLSIAVGGVGGAVLGAACGATGTAVVPYVLTGIKHALSAIPLSALPGLGDLKKAVKSRKRKYL